MTLAASIQENLFKPSDYYHSGSIKIGDTLIKDHNNGAGWGDITYLEGLKRSSNVAFVKIGQQLGMEKQLQYVKNFGFGEKTGLDLAGEKRGKSFRKETLSTLRCLSGKALLPQPQFSS